MEATLLAGMTGGTLLMDSEEDSITIAIKRDRSNPLAIAGALALYPDLAATSTEVGTSASRKGDFQRLTRDVGQHQDLFTRVILHDDWQEGLFVDEG
jgi:hypothetical protein